MPLYDPYEQYRPMLTPEQQELIQQATVRSKELASQQIGTRVPGGYEGLTGFVEDPLTAAHMKLAKEQAAEQFKKLPVMPEDGDISFRFAELDPVGKYSLIDMKFAHRYNQIQSALQTQSRDTQRSLAQLQQQMKENAAFRALHAQMRQIAEAHRLLSRASKLCWDPEGRELLHQQARALESDPVVAKYDLLLQGMEYLVGILPDQQGLPADVKKLYQDMELPVPSSPAEASVRPELLRVKFQNFNNQMFQHWHANPSHWGANDKTEPDYRPDEVYAAVQHYAASTVSCALKPVFAPARSIGLHPVDLVRIDGVSLRDMLDPNGNSDLNPTQVDEQATATIAGALIAGRKVDILHPDDLGELSDDGIPIVAEGDVLDRQHRILYNAWTRFISRQNLYLFKLMAADQAKGPVSRP